MSVLIVENDPSIATLVGSICKHQGLQCESVNDGAMAIARLRHTRFSAVVLDLMLPERDGFEVIAYLRREQPAMLRRVIVISAVSERTLGAIDAESLCAVLRKPFEVADLQDALDRAKSVEQ